MLCQQVIWLFDPGGADHIRIKNILPNPGVHGLDGMGLRGVEGKHSLTLAISLILVGGNRALADVGNFPHAVVRLFARDPAGHGNINRLFLQQGLLFNDYGPIIGTAFTDGAEGIHHPGLGGGLVDPAALGVGDHVRG